MDTREKQVRHFIYQRFVEEAQPPVLEEIMAQFQLGREEATGVLKSLEAQHTLALVGGTARILMAWPFSAVATPFRVRTGEGKQYFSNCAWDAVAFQVVLEQPVEIEAYCHETGEKIKVRIGEKGEVGAEPPETIVYLGLPAKRWWEDIIFTCSNTMVFFSSRQRLAEWRAKQQGETGQALSIEQTLQLSRPIYGNRLSLEYERPPADQLRTHFARMGLTGSFWEI